VLAIQPAFVESAQVLLGCGGNHGFERIQRVGERCRKV
jgi:hypothetical protein